jgi:hypothetical protein
MLLCNSASTASLNDLPACADRFITIPNLRPPNVAFIGVVINNLRHSSCRRPTITKYAVLISGRGQSTKRTHNGIELCTDRIAPARTDGVRRPTRLTEVCRKDCLVPTFASVPFVNDPNWSHPPDSSG